MFNTNKYYYYYYYYKVEYTRTCRCGHSYTAANLPIMTKYKSPYQNTMYTYIHDTKPDTKTTCPLRPF